ncbi:unnamed protein product [Linum trigynum]|uniref:non-specific serine/threonine protein kinase n=1 Tax=Linum trigynum TaxID=586398 RepID=A0AAV2DH34_9ROSI
MEGSSSLLSLLLPLLLLLPLPSNTQFLDLLHPLCSQTAGTYTAGSTFRRNLDSALSSIVFDTEIDNGFYKVSAGFGPDRVEAIGLCLGDLDPPNCRSCISRSASRIVQSCPNQKEAILYYDFCMLRYSSPSLRSNSDLTESAPIPPPAGAGFAGSSVNPKLADLLTRIRKEAAGGGSLMKYATGVAELGRSKTAYGLAQCIPELSGPDCDSCLDHLTWMAPGAGEIGRVAVSLSCWLWYGMLELDGPEGSCSDSKLGTEIASYGDELDGLLDSLVEKASQANFFSTGTSPGGNVHALYLCLGDVVSGEECKSCVADAAHDMRLRCPSNRSAVILREKCLVRYSDQLFFGVLEMEPRVTRGDDEENSSSSTTAPTPTTSSSGSNNNNCKAVMALVHELAGYVPYTAMMYGTNSSLTDNQSNYAMAQCTRDLNSTYCEVCLNQLIMIASGCCLKYSSGWRVQTPSCSLWYKQTLFYNPVAPDTDYSRSHDTSVSSLKVSMAVVGGAAFAAVVLAVTCFRCYVRFSCKRRLTGILNREGIQVTEHESNTTEMQFYTLAAVQAATDNFSDGNKLGEGGFGPVYRGRLPSGEEIAVKRLSMTSKQGLEEFRNEVMVILKLQHKNLVRLLGCCLERGEKLLVYEYLANTSLDVFLFDASKCKELDWEKRANIITGTARGLLYLHEDSRLKIVHRDLKASNVLLDDEMNPKISDFGTARIFGGDQHEASTDRVVGTYGYMAPEYALGGVISTKSDVYSFGILMLEIISGKKNRGPFNQEQATSLLSLAWEKWSEGRGDKLIDQTIVDGCSTSDALRWIHVGLLCTQDDPAERPDVSKVVLMLGSTAVYLPQPLKPPFSLGNFSSAGGGGDDGDDDQSSSSREGTVYSSPVSTYQSVVNCSHSA